MVGCSSMSVSAMGGGLIVQVSWDAEWTAFVLACLRVRRRMQPSHDQVRKQSGWVRRDLR